MSKSEKYMVALNSLPEELHDIFNEFVEDYRFAATKHHGRPYISYITLAEMVKHGWRCSAKPMVDKKDTKV
jgi:CRISPR/Cas system endoribonuclease Cas6 (RAMP superfamily)